MTLVSSFTGQLVVDTARATLFKAHKTRWLRHGQDAKSSAILNGLLMARYHRKEPSEINTDTKQPSTNRLVTRTRSTGTLVCLDHEAKLTNS